MKAKELEQKIATDAEYRKKLIEGWDKDTQRKDEAFKAYECLKDKTVNYVFDLLMKQFDFETVAEMQYAMSNVSILRKVIDKLAKVYANGVKRTMPAPEGSKPAPLELPPPPPMPDPNADPNAPPPPPEPPAPPKPKVLTQAEKDTALVEDAAEFFDMNAVMKKTNRYFRTFLNTLVYVKPMPVEDKFTIALEVKPPFSYDVVENPENKALPLAIVCSDYVPRRKTLYALGDAATAGRTLGVVRDVQPPGVEGLALTPSGQDDTRQFIWWTKGYHFTTNVKGEILPEYTDGTDNPVGVLPFVNFAGEQDLGFWAEGGSDLVDAGIKINVMVSNVQHIGVIQGYGQLYMSGKNLPQVVKVGPTHCIKLPQEEGDPEPKIGFLTANPPLTELQALVEMGVALMLSTNNLSTSGFTTSLKGGNKSDLASGVALMIDKSESIEDVNEQSLIFVKKEPEVWVLIQKWLDVYKSQNSLIEELTSMELPEDMSALQLKFPSPKPIISESDELDVLKKRQDMGLNSEVEIMMRDDPSLSEEEAKAKIAIIQAERAANRAKFQYPTDADESLGGPQAAAAPGGANGNQSQGGGGFQGKNGNQPGTNQRVKATGVSQNPNQK